MSRATVREAVLGLIEAGYLTRRHGSGTFVADPPRSRHALDTTVSYTAMIREAGMQPGERVLAEGGARRRPRASATRSSCPPASVSSRCSGCGSRTAAP